MRKRIAVFGCSLFQDIKYDKGLYVPTEKKAIIELSKEYLIDNYSLEGMTIARAKHLIKALPMKKLYSDCILALGEADLCQPAAFEKDLIEVVEHLQNCDVRPLLVSLPKALMLEPKGIYIQEILDKLAVKYNIDYIYEGKTDKLVSYMVLEEQDITKAILSLC